MKYTVFLSIALLGSVAVKSQKYGKTLCIPLCTSTSTTTCTEMKDWTEVNCGVARYDDVTPSMKTWYFNDPFSNAGSYFSGAFYETGGIAFGSYNLISNIPNPEKFAFGLQFNDTVNWIWINQGDYCSTNDGFYDPKSIKSLSNVRVMVAPRSVPQS